MPEGPPLACPPLPPSRRRAILKYIIQLNFEFEYICQLTLSVLCLTSPRYTTEYLRKAEVFVMQGLIALKPQDYPTRFLKYAQEVVM
jgi:hypothetical protein